MRPIRNLVFMVFLTAKYGKVMFSINYNPKRYTSPGSQVITEQHETFSDPDFKVIASHVMSI